MIIGFICVSVFIGMLMAFWWSTNGFGNVLIKTMFGIYTLYGILMLLGQLAPLINNGTLRLV